MLNFQYLGAWNRCSGLFYSLRMAVYPCSTMFQRLFRDHIQLNINISDMSIAHRLGKTTRGPDKPNIIFKLCRRDFVQDIFDACKSQKPAFFVITALTPLRSKLLYALRLLRRKFPTTIKGCRSTISGDVTAFMAASGANGGTATGASIALEATTETTSEANTGEGNRRGDRTTTKAHVWLSKWIFGVVRCWFVRLYLVAW